MATLPIHLEVEDVAVGPVLIALRKMPGIIRIDLKLLDEPSKHRSERESSGHSGSQPAKHGENAERIVAHLMKNNGGPCGIKEIIRVLGTSKGSAYTAMYTLKKRNVVKSPAAGLYELTDKAKRELLQVSAETETVKLSSEAIKLLPKPRAAAKAKANGHATKTQVVKTESGRAPPGTGQKLLLQALTGGAMKRDALIKQLGEAGMSEKSVTGVMARAQDAKLIKSLGGGQWELTTKGSNQQASDAAAPAEA